MQAISYYIYEYSYTPSSQDSGGSSVEEVFQHELYFTGTIDFYNPLCCVDSVECSALYSVQLQRSSDSLFRLLITQQLYAASVTQSYGLKSKLANVQLP